MRILRVTGCRGNMHAAPNHTGSYPMRKTLPVLLLLTASAALTACAPGDNFDPAAHEAEIHEWRAGRLERLKGPTGYMNLAG